MADKDEIKNKIDIVDYIGQTVSLKSAGRNFKGLCPFHKEKSPSFMVSPERQMYKCFGCGKSGDIFTFYMEQEGVGFSEAIKDLAAYVGVELTNFAPTDDYNQKQSLLEINQLAAKFYHFLLTKHKIGAKALDYVKNERQVSDSLISDFQIGYAPDSWSSLSDFLLKKKKISPESAEATGLIIKGDRGYYDRFRGRLIFPLFDHRHNLVGFSGRILPWTDDGKMGKYINSPETSLYHKSSMLFPLHYTKEAIRRDEQVVIVEGEFDVLSSLKAGLNSVVAVKGSALTLEQVKLLSRYTKTIILSLDADSAGIAAAKRAIDIASTQDVNIKVVRIENGKDPDELIKTDPKLWHQAIKKAESIYDFFIQTALTSYDIKTIEGKQKITEEIIPVLNKITNKVVQDFYIKKFAQILSTDKSVVLQEMSRMQAKMQLGVNFKTPDPVKKSENRLTQLLNEFLQLIIYFYKDVDLEKFDLEILPESAVGKIVSQLYKEKPKDIIIFSKKLKPELQDQFNISFMKEPLEKDKQLAQMRLTEIFNEIAKIALRDKLSQVSQKLSVVVSEEEKEKLTHQYNEILVCFRRYSK